MVTLGVSVMVAAVKFYEEGLGFPNMESPPTVAFFTLNGSGLGLYNRDSLDEDASISAEGSGFNDFALAHNVASRTEVNKAIERLAPHWLRRLRKCSGAVIQGTSKTWTDTCGKLLIILSFGLGLSGLSDYL